MDFSAGFGAASGSFGVEIILYWGTQEAKDNGGLVIAIYLYGGIGIDLVESVVDFATITDLLIQYSDLMELDGVSALQTLMSFMTFNLSISVSGVLICGNENFKKASDYSGWFDTYSFSSKTINAAYSWSDKCTAYCIGGSIFSTSISWGISRSRIYYVLWKCSTQSGEIKED